VHWLANVDIATLAIEVLPYVKKYVETVKKLSSNITCINVVKAALAKLPFFSSVAATFEPFLSNDCIDTQSFIGHFSYLV